MKKFVGTYLMIALAAVIAGYTYWEFKHAVDDIDPSKGERLAFSLGREQVDHVELNSKGESVTLEKNGGRWSLTKPVTDMADDAAVESFLFSLAAQRVRTFRGEDEGRDIKWADYGLAPGGSSLELAGGGKKEKLEVGTKNAYDGSFYVRQKEDVLLGDKGLAQVVERPATSFRSRKVWREDDARIERVTIEHPDTKDKIVFNKNGKNWEMEPKPNFEFDRAKFESWVNKVEEFMPADVVKEGIEPADKAQDLLAIPSQVIQFDFSKKDAAKNSWTLTLGQDRAEDVFLFSSTRPTLYKSSKAVVDPLRVSAAYFRDGHVPFAFDAEQVRLVRIRAPKFNHEFKKSGSTWSLVNAGKDENLAGEKLEQFLVKLHGLEATDFLAQGNGLGQSPQIELRDVTDKLLLALSLGDDYKAKSPWIDGKQMKFIKSSLGQEVLGLEKSVADHLIDPLMVTTTKAPKPGGSK